MQSNEGKNPAIIVIMEGKNGALNYAYLLAFVDSVQNVERLP